MQCAHLSTHQYGNCSLCGLDLVWSKHSIHGADGRYYGGLDKRSLASLRVDSHCCCRARTFDLVGNSQGLLVGTCNWPRLIDQLKTKQDIDLITN